MITAVAILNNSVLFSIDSDWNELSRYVELAALIGPIKRR